LNTLRVAVSGCDGRPPTAAAFRCVTEYQPAGGAGDKVFPPTYEGGKYAMEKRRLPGQAEPVDCVLLDSVQSQANRMELALLEAWEAKRISLPVITVDFGKAKLERPVPRITSLEAPHRLADAILRDSELADGKRFSESKHAAVWGAANIRQATAIFELCPTALVFGMWGSPEKPGGLRAKFSRTIVSEIVGLAAIRDTERMGYRIDPLGIKQSAAVVMDGKRWKLAGDGKSKDTLRPSEINHSNIPFKVANGGVTLDKALQTTVVSLPALRRLRFPPLNGAGTGKPSDRKVDDAARTALAALALCAATLTREQGCDLRSRCLLVPTTGFEWELLGPPSEQPKRFTLTSDGAIALLRDAVKAAKDAGLPWMDEELILTPSPELVELVKKSQDLSAATVGGDEGGEG